MMLSVDAVGLISAVFVAASVEFVEAFTIVLAMGITRGWRSALTGTVAAVLTLAVVTAVLGVALRDFVNPALLQLVVGTLLLVFGLQWVRKAVLRSAGLKALHDESEIFAEELAEARDARSEQHFGIDGFGFIVSYKGVLLEGLEVVFIVVTFGLGAAHRGLPDAMLMASLGAVAAGAAVITAGVVMRRPLAMVPENTMKYAVGLLLSSFGVFWVVEGMGYFSPLGTSLEWPGDIWSLVGIFFAWLVISRITVLALRPLAARDVPVAVPGAETGA